MAYSKSNYALEQLQKERDLATDPVVVKEYQKEIDAYFLGSDKKKKSKKERRRERRRERQKIMEEEEY